MKLAVLSVLAYVALVALGSAPAGAQEFDNPPNAEFGAVSTLNATHMGNYIIGRGDGVHTKSQLEEMCWDAWVTRWNHLVWQSIEADDGEYGPDDYIGGVPTSEPIPVPNPDFCTERTGYKFENPPADVADYCPPGTAAAYMGFTIWLPSGGEPGHYAWEYLDVGSTSVSPYLFECYEIFDPLDDVLRVTEEVLEPTFDKSPTVAGLTGLDTWLWFDMENPASHTITATATVPVAIELDLTIEGTAWVDKIQWDMDGDGTWDEAVDFPDTWDTPPDHDVYVDYGGGNSEDDAAAMYIYETKGVYDVRIGVTWRGIYTITTGDFFGLYAYPPVTREYVETYRVCEIRAIPTVGQAGDEPQTCTP